MTSMATASSSSRRGWLLVLVAVGLAAGSALAMSLLSTSQYRASAEVLVLVRVRSIESEALVATSSEVVAEVREVVGDGPDLAVEVVGDDTLRFTAESTNAETAATAANVHVAVYTAPRGDSVEVTERATTPSDPFEPQTVRNVLLAAAAGLLIGLLAPVLVKRFDPTIRTAGQLAALTGVPNLGVIPRIGPVDAGTGVAVERDPNSLVSDAAESFRSAFESAVGDAAVGGAGTGVVLVTSPQCGEGSSSAAVTLASAEAVAGRKVVLIDGCLTDPAVHGLLGLGNEVGLSSVLQGTAPLRDAVQRSTFEPNLAVLPAGPTAVDSAEISGSDRLSRVLGALSSAADLVVIDAPPVLTGRDTTSLLHQADVVLLSGTAGVSNSRDWAAAGEYVTAADAAVIGTVLCQPD